MRYVHAITRLSAVGVTLLLLGLSSGANAANTSASHATLAAQLVDANAKAQKKAATVEVKVTGIKLVDPAAAKEKPKAGQGHLHYQLDSDPIIATTATKLSFHELPPGQHQVKVMLAANDHSPLGPEQTLTVVVP